MDLDVWHAARVSHDVQKIVAHYEQVLEGGADDQKRVGWRASHSQDVAFLSLARVEGLGDGASVLDVGCGLGGLKAFFDQKGWKIDYTGVDVTPGMIEGARARHPGVRFEVRDILREPMTERFDYVISSGALTYRIPDHERFVADMIDAMYARCRTALAFNMLSAHAYAGSPTLQRKGMEAHYVWPEQILRWCRHLSPLVSVLHDVDVRRFDVFVYRRNPAAAARLAEHKRPGKTWSAAARAVIEYHLDLGLHAEALAAAEGMEPNAELLVLVGRARLSLGDVAGAVAEFTRAIELDPSLAMAHFWLGRIAAKAGRLKESVSRYQRAAELAPEMEELAEAWIRTLLRANRREEAREAIAKMPPSPLAWLLASYLIPNAGEARALLERALEVAPSFMEALAQLGFLCERTGDHAGALAVWRRAREVAPTDASIERRIESLLRISEGDKTR
jgi:predicted TPR repeat methyltransferase